VAVKVAISFFLLCVPVIADVAAGELAMKKGDYATAIKEFLPLAKQGDAAAQSLLGELYDKGRGVQQDDKEAARWYRLAADQGNAGAQSMLGDLYAEGRGVPQDDKKAVRWYQLAADQGDAVAQLELAFMYETGKKGAPGL
jgi:TPR repeat protein